LALETRSMHIYSSYSEAIIGLLDRGFSNDFILFGENLFWTQEKSFIKQNNFSIAECYQFAHPLGSEEDLTIFGIIVFSPKIKGILMNHYSYNSKIPDIISKKLNGMGFYSSWQNLR